MNLSMLYSDTFYRQLCLATFLPDYSEAGTHLSKKTVRTDERQMSARQAGDMWFGWLPRLGASAINSSEPKPGSNKRCDHASSPPYLCFLLRTRVNDQRLQAGQCFFHAIIDCWKFAS